MMRLVGDGGSAAGDFGMKAVVAAVVELWRLVRS
jgi:hypothetical protein